MRSRLSLLLFILFLTSSLAQSPNWGQCYVTRLTSYEVGLDGNNQPEGTCSFGYVRDKMHPMFKQGYIIATSEELYNVLNAAGDWYGWTFTNGGCYGAGSNTSGVICGGGCGECYEVYGPKGKAIFMSADIGDVGSACAGKSTCDNIDGVGGPPTLPLNGYRYSGGFEAWKDVAYGLSHVNGLFKKVPCPVAAGGVGIYFTEFGGTNQWSFTVTPFNYAVQVAKIEAQGFGPGVASNNPWSDMPRTWTNKWEWRITGAGGPKTYGVYNGGNQVKFRLTSVLGDQIEFGSMVLPSGDPWVFSSGTQFSSNVPKGADCIWYPPALIYDEQVTNNGNSYEGVIPSQWSNWGAWGSSPNFQYTSGCYSGSKCIKMNWNANFPGVQFGYTNQFSASLFTNIEFYAKSANGPMNGFSVGFDGPNNVVACSSVNTGPIGTSWTKISIPLSSMQCTSDVLVLKFYFGGDSPFPDLYFDKIGFTGPTHGTTSGTLISTGISNAATASTAASATAASATAASATATSAIAASAASSSATPSSVASSSAVSSSATPSSVASSSTTSSSSSSTTPTSVASSSAVSSSATPSSVASSATLSSVVSSSTTSSSTTPSSVASSSPIPSSISSSGPSSTSQQATSSSASSSQPSSSSATSQTSSTTGTSQCSIELSACASSPSTLYADVLASSWQANSSILSSPADMLNTEQTYKGEYSIKWTPASFASITFAAKNTTGYFDSSQWNTISFWVNGGTIAGQQVQIIVTDASDRRYDSCSVMLSSFFGDDLPASDWYKVYVPMSMFGLSSTQKIKAFSFQDTTGGNQDALYLDEIQFECVAPTQPPSVAQPPIFINFQPLNSPTPTGYYADVGRKYGSGPGGLEFGWTQDISSATFDSNDITLDTRFNTGVDLRQLPSASWSIKIPNGDYQIQVGLGSASNFGNVGLNINDASLSGSTTATSQFILWQMQFSINDQRLNISTDKSVNPTNNFLDFVTLKYVWGTTVRLTFSSGLKREVQELKPNDTELMTSIWKISGVSTNRLYVKTKSSTQADIVIQNDPSLPSETVGQTIVANLKKFSGVKSASLVSASKSNQPKSNSSGLSSGVTAVIAIIAIIIAIAVVAGIVILVLLIYRRATRDPFRQKVLDQIEAYDALNYGLLKDVPTQQDNL